MKLNGIKFGLTTPALCAFALFGCDPAPGGTGMNSSGTGDNTGGNSETGETSDNDDDNTGTGTGPADGASETVGAEATAGESEDDGPIGEGMDPPTFECPAAGAGETLVDKYFTIDDGEFDEVAKLDGVTVIDGNVDINRSRYNNLDFLNCITEITGDLTIFGNDFMVDVSGTNNLAVLGGDFVFSGNNALTRFDGMALIERIYRSPNDDPPPQEIYHSIVMNQNKALEEIAGWDNLEFIFGNIMIRDNPVLKNIDGFKGLKGIGLTLVITYNESLCMSSVNCVGAGIVSPAPDEIPDQWTTEGNDKGC